MIRLKNLYFYTCSIAVYNFQGPLQTNMKPLLFICMLITVFCSCTKTDNSSVNAVCTDSCTTVQGRFLTGNSEPIRGLSLEIRSESRPTLGLGQTTIRKLATGQTDNNGFYAFTFSLKRGEYGESNRYLLLKADYDRSSFLPVPWYDLYGTDEIVPVRGRKDTTVTMNYFLASKAQLRLQLNNFTPSATADSFYILPVYYNVGYSGSQVTETQFFVSSQTNNEKIVPVAGNQQNKISIVRKKNGVRTVRDTTVFTPTNQTTTLTLNY